MWTARAVQVAFAGDEHPVGCIHVYGLFAQHFMAAGPDELCGSVPYSRHRARSALLPWASAIPGLTGRHHHWATLHHPVVGSAGGEDCCHAAGARVDVVA